MGIEIVQILVSFIIGIFAVAYLPQLRSVINNIGNKIDEWQKNRDDKEWE